jgi:hypothetical protein
MQQDPSVHGEATEEDLPTVLECSALEMQESMTDKIGVVGTLVASVKTSSLGIVEGGSRTSE